MPVNTTQVLTGLKGLVILYGEIKSKLYEELSLSIESPWMFFQNMLKCLQEHTTSPDRYPCWFIAACISPNQENGDRSICSTEREFNVRNLLQKYWNELEEQNKKDKLTQRLAITFNCNHTLSWKTKRKTTLPRLHKLPLRLLPWGPCCLSSTSGPATSNHPCFCVLSQTADVTLVITTILAPRLPWPAWLPMLPLWRCK